MSPGNDNPIVIAVLLFPRNSGVIFREDRRFALGTLTIGLGPAPAKDGRQPRAGYDAGGSAGSRRLSKRVDDRRDIREDQRLLDAMTCFGVGDAAILHIT